MGIRDIQVCFRHVLPLPCVICDHFGTFSAFPFAGRAARLRQEANAG